MTDRVGWVVVTGSTSGIGRAIAERLSADGYRVAGVDRAAPGRTSDWRPDRFIEGDIADRTTHVRAAESIEGGLAGWVNCAGITALTDLEDLDEALVRRLVDVNLVGTLWGVSEALGRVGDGGAIVNISSVHSSRAYPKYGVYEMTKAGIDALTRSAAVQGSPKNIRVNAVAPGAILTEALATSLASAPDAEAATKALAERAPLARIGSSDEVAGVASFLLGPDASYLTGQVIVVDGGWSALLGRDTNPSARRFVGGSQ